MTMHQKLRYNFHFLTEFTAISCMLFNFSVQNSCYPTVTKKLLNINCFKLTAGFSKALPSKYQEITIFDKWKCFQIVCIAYQKKFLNVCVFVWEKKWCTEKKKKNSSGIQMR